MEDDGPHRSRCSRGFARTFAAPTSALDALRQETNERLDTMARRIVESEVRTSSAIADLAGTVREMTGVLRAANDLRPRLDRCEHDIEELKRRVG